MSPNKSVYKWTAIDRICTSVMTFGGNILLARLLDPSDFGLLGMVAIFSALAYNISGCGMSDGLINKKNPTATDYSTVFVFNAGMGIIFATIFISCSGLIADFFGYSELKGIMIAIGICFFFQSLALVQETRMRKDLDFKKMAIVRLSATASSLILAIILVIYGYGYWGLVSMQIFLSFFLSVYYIAASRWIPKIAFKTSSFKEMFGYGVHLMVAYLCYQIARNISMSVLGKYSTASVSGDYNQAHKLQEVPYALTEAILNWPFFAVLAAIDDAAERRKQTSRMHTVIVFVNVTLTCYLFTVSAYVFGGVFGEKWNGAIPIFQILLLFGLATTLKQFYQTILKAHSVTKIIKRFTIIEVTGQLILLAIFYKSSATTIAFTQVMPALVLLGAYVDKYIRLEGIKAGEYIKECFRPMILPVAVTVGVICLTIYWAPDINSLLAFFVVSAIYATVMLATCEFFKPDFYMALRARFIKPKN